MAKRITASNRKVCDNGHVFYKTSSCPVCPICEKERTPVTEFFFGLSAPARRALENAGIKTPEELSKKSESDILKLHGIGPSSLPKLRSALQLKGLSFKK